MAQANRVRVTLATLLAMLAAGCGSAATSSSTGTSPARAVAAAHTTPAKAAGAIPPGFARYHANGFSFLAPRRFAPAPDGGVAGLPAGASVKFLTPGGRPLQKTNTQIMIGFNPKLRFDIDQVATNLRAADSVDPSLTNARSDVAAVTVADAAGARIVTESYDTKPPNAIAFKRTWLMVTPRPGVLMDLVVIVEPGRGGTLNPATVLNTFRLDG